LSPRIAKAKSAYCAFWQNGVDEGRIEPWRGGVVTATPGFEAVLK